MSVALTSLVPYLRSAARQATTGASDSTLTASLGNAFWTAHIEGFTALHAYREVDGIIEPVVSGASDISRDVLQVVVVWAATNEVSNALLELDAVFRVKAGNVEYETQKQATVLKGVLDLLVAQRNQILTRLADSGKTDVAIIDAAALDARNLLSGLSSFPSAAGWGPWEE